jgi:putative MATE family efflux protein
MDHPKAGAQARGGAAPVVAAGADARRAAATAAARAQRTRLLLEGPIAPTLAKLAAPNVLAMCVQSAQSIAEAYFASLMGVTALAGLALVFPLVMLTQMLSAGAIGGAMSAAVARALGAADEGRAAALTLAAWIIAAGLALVMALLVAMFGSGFFAMLGGGSEAVAAASAYALVFFSGSLAIWLCNASLSVMRGTGDMRTPALLLLLVSVLSILLSGALALGWGPLPALGMTGLALGPILAFAVGAGIAVGSIVMGRSGLVFRGVMARLNGGMFRDILGVGALAAINTVMTTVTIIMMTGLVGRFGAAALAGYGLGARLEFLMIPVIFGIGAAMTAMVGANIGAGQTARALRVAWTGAGAAAAIVGGIGLILAVFPDLWLGMFLDASETEARAAGQSYFRHVAPFYGFFGLGLALYFASQGAGQMLWPMLSSLGRMIVALLGALLLLRLTDLGLDAIFIAIGAAMVVYGMIVSLAIRRSGWTGNKG